MDSSRWHALFEGSPLFVLVLDREGKILDINRTIAPYRKEDVVGRSGWDFIAPGFVAEAKANLARVFETGVAIKAETHTASGQWFSVQTIPVTVDGTVREALLVSDDTTIAKTLQHQLERRERVFRALVEKSHEGFLLLAADGQVLYSSPSTSRLLGISDGSDPFSIVHPDDFAEARRCVEQALSVKTPVRGQARIFRDGETRIIEFVLVNMLEDPDVAGIVSNYRDITDLAEARHARDKLFELSLDLMCVAGPDGHFEKLNPAWEETLGWTAAEMMARPYLDFVHPDDRNVTTTTHDDATRRPITTFENRYRCRDGSYRWIQWKSARDDGTGLIYAIARDVTAKKRLDERLLNAQKMEAIARLAGGVAHDINNMLAVIYASTESLLATLPAEEPARVDVQDIREVAERSAALVSQLLEFGRKSPRTREREHVEIDGAVARVAKMLSRVVPAHIAVSVRTTAHATVHANAADVESLVMNLALNARDAMPEGGALTISTSVRRIPSARAADLGIAAGRYAAVEVRDTGSGIPRELQAKIFEPFFTTKAVGEGTGLGLSMVFAIIEAASGTIEVESTEGRGSTFTVLLPCELNRPDSKERSSAPSASPS